MTKGETGKLFRIKGDLKDVSIKCIMYGLRFLSKKEVTEDILGQSWKILICIIKKLLIKSLN